MYHGAGLLPSNLLRGTWVLSRCAKAEATCKRGERRVNQLGVLLTNDYPKDVAKGLFVDSWSDVGCFLAGGLPWLSTLLEANGEGIITKSKKITIDNEGGTEGDSGTKQIDNEGNSKGDSGPKRRGGDEEKSEREKRPNEMRLESLKRFKSSKLSSG